MSSKFNFLKQDLTAMTQDKDFFCFDVETTGLSPSDNRIIQLSMIHVDLKESNLLKLIE